MVVGPIAVALDEGIPWFGTQTSQAELAAESGVVFQVYKWEVVLNDIIAQIEDGVLGGTSYTVTLENEGIAMEISEFAGMEEEAVDALQERIDELTEAIVSGDIVIFPEEDMEAESSD